MTSISCVWITLGRSQIPMTRRVPRNAVGPELVSVARRPRLVPDHVVQGAGLWCVDAARVILGRMEMVGLGQLPNDVGARAAVPDSDARPFGTRPLRSGAYGLAVVPIPPPRWFTISRNGT